ncbi:MAG: transcriptional repressor [Ruminiclostridium sp.]|jgi:Fur family ferric uptake transcriptional regulator|nr:transcriptional repressor [Ruminiclostridium sp.]
MAMGYREILAGKGLKHTKTRALVLEVLNQAHIPMTADELFLILKRNEPSINLSTVYRTLDTLVKKSLIMKTTWMDDSRSCYEYNRMDHRHHLVCVGCNRVISVKGCPIDEYASAVCSHEGFEPAGHRLEIYGVCSNCKKRVKRVEE